MLGDQLIRNPALAVFEMVKNAYDADATKCVIQLEHPTDPEHARILIEDNGSGMNEKVLRDAWMVIATDFREKQKRPESTRTGRRPLGEKGLGRLSAHKLGRHVKLITRMKGDDEFELLFDWDKLEAADDLKTAGVKLTRRTPKVFEGNRSGTRLEITRLRQAWSRAEARDLHRSVTSLCSPFRGPTGFMVRLEINHDEDWLDKLLLAKDVKKCALYHVSGYIEGDHVVYDYAFKPPPGVELAPTCNSRTALLQAKVNKKVELLDLSKFRIGKVEFEFWLFDLDTAVLRHVTNDVRGLKEYMKINGGVKLYRDGIRVYDFGEPDNDWLGLDLLRVNTPTVRTSRNQVLGSLRLDSEQSLDLEEKANREGFIETPASKAFINAILSVFKSIEADRHGDQRRVRAVLGKGTASNINSKLDDLREVLRDMGQLEKAEPELKKLEVEIERYSQVLLRAAVPGMAFGSMIHNAEKKLDDLRHAVKQGAPMNVVRSMVDELYKSLQPVTVLLKNPGTIKTTAAWLIRQAVSSAQFRFKAHGIELQEGLQQGGRDFAITGPPQVLIGAITNLLSNAIHWLAIGNPKAKRLYIGTDFDIDGGPCIVVGDNGPGFGNDTPEDLLEPFFGRRPGGMGLGLYLVNEVMTKLLQGPSPGRVLFPSKGEITLPKVITGAVIALQFPNPL
jgi:signal transduction histidine kinase